MRFRWIDGLTFTAIVVLTGICLLLLPMDNLTLAKKESDVKAESNVKTYTIPPVFGNGPFVVEHDLPVRNSTQSLLRFSGIASSCGCSEAVLKKMELAPNEETSIHLASCSLVKLQKSL
jgi:hypothetical protein